MFFEMEEYRECTNMDVATFLSKEIQEYPEEVICIKNNLLNSNTNVTVFEYRNCPVSKDDEIPQPSIAPPTRSSKDKKLSLFTKRTVQPVMDFGLNTSDKAQINVNASTTSPAVNHWKYEGSGLLQIKDDIKKAGNIPPQTPINNVSLKRVAGIDSQNTTEDSNIPSDKKTSVDERKSEKPVNLMGGETFKEKAER